MLQWKIFTLVERSEAQFTSVNALAMNTGDTHIHTHLYRGE